MSDIVRTTINWQGFNDNKVILPICVRSPNVDGRNFIRMLDAMKGRISHVELVLCDYLDRYNLNGDGVLAMEQSWEWQDKYVEEVRSRFASVRVMGWKEIMCHPLFDQKFKIICDLYQKNEAVKKAIDINVDIYVRDKVKRQVKDGNWDYDPVAIELNSRNYLLEEYAGTAIYKNFVPTKTQIYWGVYIDDVHVFNRHSGNVDLEMPRTLPVTNSRLGASIRSIRAPEESTLYSYA